MSDWQPNCDRIHDRLLTGDPVASTDLVRCHAGTLERQLAGRFRTTDPDTIHDAVVEALLDLIDRPQRFDPARRSLAGYLLMAATADLLNLRDRDRRRREHETADDPVEIDALGRNIDPKPSDPAWGRDLGDDLADREAAAALTDRAMAVAKTEEERTVMRLMLAEEKTTAVYAQALGFDHLPSAEQQSRVSSIKDRLKKRLSRMPRSSDG